MLKRIGDALNQYMKISSEIRQALINNQPVVALESTIISHGLPYPQNLEMAKKVEDIIRNERAVPATIAIINGVIRIGLDQDALNILAQSQDVMKISRRDIPYALTQGKHGATTVSSTMFFAAQAGIKVFATGGIGGVHRGAHTTFDISADLEELSQTDVAVVCAGAKSILDLPKTLEYLETKGVPVIGYKTDALPAFYTESSDLSVDYRVDDVASIARMMHAKWAQGINGGMVIANPIPASDALDKDYINSVIDAAIVKAENQGITGKAMTPFLLDEVQKATKGASLKANLALVYNNALVAAQLAVQYHEPSKQ